MKNKKQKRLLLCLCSAFLLSTLSVGMVACKKGDDKPTSDSSVSSSVEEGNQKSGVYYFQSQDKEVVLTLNNGTFTLAVGEELDSGSYVYNDAGFVLTFVGGETVTVADENDVLTLTYKGGEYRLVSKTTYTVSFDVDGGSEVAAVNVLNGKTLAKPADPTKENYEFIGWYEDEAYTTPFAFNSTPISGNKTLYARFVEESDDEYTVSFVVDGATDVYAPVSTKGGKAFDLPVAEKEGATFLGWWMSDYQDETKLTRQYNGEKLTQNVTLYAVWVSDAPAVSVTETGFEWSIGASAQQYLVQVKDAAGNVLNNDGKGETLSATSCKYDFSALSAGEYTVVVSVSGGKATTAYFKNKALDRVSSFTVAEPSLLVFNGVENAESYIISIVCGNEEHDHVSFNNGKSTNYNFGNCAMKEGGIEFTVTAVAKGYVSSVSETFKYSRDLAAVSGLKVDEEADEVRWNKVSNATSYVVEVSKGGEIVDEINVGATTNYSLKNYTGELTVKVYAVAEGYNADKTAQVVYNKTTLASPTNVRIEGSTVLWDAVEGASSYSVKIGDTAYEATGTSFTMTDANFTEGKDDYAISVRAVSEESGKSSSYSNALTVRYATMADTLDYQAGMVTWEHVITAARYGIKVNDGEMQYVDAGTNALSVTLTQAGENTIEVCYYDKKGVVSESVAINVYAYEIDFEEAGGNTIHKIYKAIGDPLNLPASEQPGYDFGGWYNVPGGANSNGTKFNNDSVIKGNTLLYAYWKAKSYNVTFAVNDKEGTAPTETSVAVQFNETYKLPVAVSKNPSKTFGGWYAGNVAYTDPLGNAINGKLWDISSDTELKAKWIDIFEYTSYDGGQTYTVSAGSGLSYVTEITIPVNYVDDEGNSFPITTVGLFNGAEKLEIVRIPDTITWIEVGSAGPNGAGAAFRKCENLKRIEIYEVEGAHDKLWESSDGVLIYNNPVTLTKELKYIPYARTEAYRIPDGITSIPVNAFRNTKITQVTIPSSVTLIEEYAFYGCADLQHVIFENSETAAALTIGGNAFYNCKSLQYITLPARLSEIQQSTFALCSNLTNIEVEAGEGATYKSIDGVLCVDKEIFYAPLALNVGENGRYEIPAGITTIAAKAFQKNSTIKTLVVPYFVERIGEEAFAEAKALTKIEFQGTADMGSDLEIASKAFYACYGLSYKDDDALVLPGNLKKLGASAFGATYELKSVKLEATTGLDFANGVFTEETHGKAGRVYLEKLYIGKDVEVISVSGVFGGSSLEEVTVHPENMNYETLEGVLYDQDITQIMYYPMGRKETTYTLPSTVTTITTGVFQEQKYLKTVNIPATVSCIEDRAFFNCANLTTVNFLAAAKGETEAAELVLNDDVFALCKALTTINLPTRTTQLGDNVFQGAEALTTITIPEGVTSIGSKVFYACKNLTTINLPASLISISSYADNNYANAPTVIFGNMESLTTITVAEGNTAYKVQDGIFYALTDGAVGELIYTPVSFSGERVEENGVVEYVVTIPATVTKVWDGAFQNNKNITKIVFAERDSATSLELGNSVFSGAAKLATIELPEGLTEIGESMFRKCESLKTIVIPSTVSKIGNSAFMQCDSLENVIFTPTAEGKMPVGLSFGETVFYQCKSLKKITLPTRTIFIAYQAFKQLGAEEFTMPDTAIFGTSSSKYGSTFEKSDLLKKVTFVPGVEKYLDASGVEQTAAKIDAIPMQAFMGCEMLSSINIPNTVTKIESKAFMQCTALKNIEIPSSVVSIGTEAFNLAGLTSITLNEGLEIISSKAFYQGFRLASVTIPASVTTIGDSAFYRCTKLAEVNFAKGTEALTINANVFQYCSALREIEIPARTKSIGGNAFQYCQKLSSITFEVDETTQKSNVGSIGTGAFIGCPVSEMVFPETTSTLNLAAGIFDDCKKLGKVTIPSTVPSLNDVFSGCYSLTKIIVKDNTNFVIPDAMPFVMDNDQKTIHYIIGELPAGAYTIADGITTIGASTFGAQLGITSITIPASVTSIESNAFLGCLNLKEVKFAEGSALSAIGAYAFQNCASLQSITLPSSVTSIGNYAFEGCTGLTSATFTTDGATFSLVGTYMFQNCSSLTTVNLSAGVKTISNGMFQNCKSLTSIDLPEGIVSIGTYAFKNSGLVSITIPSSVKCLCATSGSHTRHNSGTADTFADCMNLVSVNLPDTLTYIGRNVFRNCSKLSYISLPAALTNIERDAFRNTGLTSVDFSKVTKAKLSLGQDAFSENYNLTSINFGIVNTLGTNMFKGCTALETIDLSKITTLGSSAFGGCTSLKNVTLNSSLTALATGLFGGCTSLESIVLPGGLTTIGQTVFANCTALKTVQYMGANGPVGDEGKVTLPDTLTSFGNNTFMNAGIEYVTIPSGVTMLGAAPASSSGSSGGSSGSIGGGLRPTLPGIGGGGMIPIVPGGGGSTTNSDFGIFIGCESLTTVVLHDKVTAIGRQTFKNCPALTTVSNTSGVTGINEEAFYGCTSLKTLDVSKVETFAAKAFQDCTSLNAISLYSKVSDIPNNMFQNCVALMSINLPDAVKTIGANAFDGSAITMMVIPKNVTTIGAQAFANCTNLEDILVDSDNGLFMSQDGLLYSNMKLVAAPAGKTGKVTIADGATLGSNAFLGCSGITELVLPAGLTEIADSAFVGLTNVTEIVLPESVEVIGAGAFSGCSSLSELVLPQYVHTIKSNAFNGCESLTTLEIPASVTTLAASAFAYCYIQTITIPENITVIANNMFEGAKTEVVNFLGEVTEIGERAFKDSGVKQTGTDTVTLDDGTVLPAVVLPETVKMVKFGMLENAAAQALVLPDGLLPTGTDDVSTIGNSAFGNAAKLEYVKLPAELNKIGVSWFKGCTSLKKVVLPNTVREICAQSFQDSGLEEINIPESVLTIGSSAFKNSNLKAIEIPSSVSTIDVGAFVGTDLVSVVIPETVTKLGVAANSADSGNVIATEGVFTNCELLEEVVIAGPIDILNAHMFEGCTSLRSVTLPDCVRRIGTAAFKDCVSLNGLVIPESATDLWTNVFAGWTASQRVYFELSERLAVTGWTCGADWNSNSAAKAVWDYKV